MTHPGYILVDCTGIDLIKSEKQTITGIYKKCEAAMDTGKLVLAANCEWDKTPVSPISVLLTTPAGPGVIVATASTLQLWIDSDDGVEVHNMAPST